MGTNGRPGSGDHRPDKGLMDIPKLSAQRKEEIRGEIMSGIRSWTKVPRESEQRQTRQIRKRKLWAGGGIGAGALALAAAAMLILPWQGNDSGTGIPNGPTPSVSAGQGSDTIIYPDAPSIPGIDGEEMPEGIADPLVPLTYEEFRSRWEAKAGSEDVRINAADKDGQLLSGALPMLNENRQNFGDAAKGYGYNAWTNAEGNELRELAFRLGPSNGTGEETEADRDVIRYVTEVLQPDLPQADRDELMDRLRFRDFDRKGGSRIAESAGLVYTLDRNGDRQILFVQFMRAEDQPDELGKWQDKLLDTVRKSGVESE
ncbi:hypothetical protein CDO73_07525 [Saccharibacillus sp. O23]|uniref:hypothetical protein n=1 Tax=Saccharibacillus sp. O23 TaxID=2009338 RepID=UPI000B4E2383|nr:hypothetical protein [Saccharibacillus sp. O23]OWR31244.1 hypothetical protein CDO73_07525 [Saccharibacillus sp. O23]